MVDKIDTQTTKKCPHCQSDIPLGAKRCPKCQSDLRNWFVRHPILTVLGILVLIITISSTKGALDTAREKAKTTIEQGQQTQQTETQQTKQKSIEIVDVDTKVTESNNVWWKYAWVLTLKNNTSSDKSVRTELKWVDAEGFVIDSAIEWSLLIPAGEEKTFNGYELIDASVAPNVDGIEAEING